MLRVIILDGYTDEPAGLGVPPYLDVYPRYIAGAIWDSVNADILYFTIDQVRKSYDSFARIASKVDLMVVIAGVVVPGRYIGGTPISFDEAVRIASTVEGPLKVLAGPAARFGFGVEGGKLAHPPETFEEYYDLVIRGDPEVVIHDLVKEGLRIEVVDPYARRVDYSEVNRWAVKGARIAAQHPNFGKNLIVEIETYRGCPRWVAGCCSFCVERMYGEVTFRDIKAIAEEVRALYEIGVRNFRLGRQPDFFSYMAKGVNEVEFPEPNPQAIECLLASIRSAAPQLETLHIDNVNPGTVANHPQKSAKVAKILIKYHTPGDVAAMGIESADPHVVRQNRLKVMPEDALKAIKLLNEVGARRGWNGLPELLPGINFVAGLIGETRKTYELNIEFLKNILRSGLVVRRVNIRQVLPLPGTPMWAVGTSILERHKHLFKRFKRFVREVFDVEMIKRVVPRGTVLRGLCVESWRGGYSLARQPGSYPLLVYIPQRLPLWTRLDVVVVNHGPRSVTGIPYPLNVNTANRRVLELVPGMSRSLVVKVLRNRPFRSVDELNKLLSASPEVLKYLTVE